MYLMERIEAARQNPAVDLFFIEAALLIEAGYGEVVDEMWYIYAEEGIRRKRLAANRGYTEERIQGIISKQLSEEAFRAACDFVVDNSGALEDTKAQIDRRLAAYPRRCTS